MDDDYNVINDRDGEGLDYPDDGDFPEAETIVNETAGVLTELNGLGRRSAKRKFCDLLDDPSSSHPIDWHMRMPLTLEERESKRNKKLIEEEILDRVTNKIVEARVRKAGTEFNTSDREHVEDDSPPKGQVLHMPPTDGSDWIGISSDGNEQRFYIRMVKRKIKKDEDLAVRNNTFSLLNLPDVQMEVAKLKEQKRNEEGVSINMETSAAVGLANNKQQYSLWVDKYTPVTYADLAVNRNTLTWLKLWDECVFRRKIENFVQLVDEKEAEIFSLDSGKVRRPQHKVLLLSGPPGLGKTTLAKIVAKHAGYDTVEVNASDSRTIGDFEKILEGAVRSSRTINKTGKGKPICLIIDEIDGAPFDSIRYLLKSIQASGKKMLRRPIICICNNLFARALRELRAAAFSLVVVPPKEERLVQRLAEISTKEHICIDRNTLSHLVHMCSCDIRQALNILQYVTATKSLHDIISLQEVQKAIEHENLGSNSIFDGWSAILEFTKHVDKKRTLLSEEKRIFNIQRLIRDETNDRFITGLHSNYLRLALPIKTLHKAAQIFLFHDEINRVLSHTQNYIVLRYEIAFFALLHLTVATHHRIQLKFPQLEQNATQRLKESKETLSMTRSQLSCRQTTADLIKDLFPFIITIVQPPIKPMNEQLYGRKEREMIKKVVATMHSFNLTYAPTMVNTQVHYTFQPPIDVLTLYNLSDTTHRLCISNSIRQMIARHLELFRLRSQMPEEVEKTSKNRAIEAVENTRRPKDTKRIALYFHFNHSYNNAVKKNVRCIVNRIAILMSNKTDEQILTLSKIEFSMLFLIEQLLVPSHPKKVRLKTSINEDEPVSEYAPRFKEKLSHDICVLSQVHLLLRNGQYSTKRDLYYDNKLLYGAQPKFDRSLTNVCHILNCERGILNVLSSSKGLITGSLTLLPNNGSVIDCRKQSVLIAESLMTYRPLSAARFILVVEKDASFQKLIDDDFFELFEESILVTGKGYPDICTRKFLRWIVANLSIPIYGLFDADPHGIEILLTYKYGSSTEKAEGRDAFVKKIQWLGVKPSDIQSMQIAEKQHLSMVYRDYSKIIRIRRRASGLGELDVLREQKYKFEIESISSIGHRFLPRFYLYPRLSHL